MFSVGRLIPRHLILIKSNSKQVKGEVRKGKGHHILLTLTPTRSEHGHYGHFPFSYTVPLVEAPVCGFSLVD